MIAMVLAGGMSALSVFSPSPILAKGFRAGEVLEKMTSKELNAYITGITEGLAYARYEKEGKKTDGGMQCIDDWLFKNDGTITNVVGAFKKYKNYTASAVIAAMVKQVCGE